MIVNDNITAMMICHKLGLKASEDILDMEVICFIKRNATNNQELKKLLVVF